LQLLTELQGSGEALATVYFGQAFEDPPHFTWSAAATSADVAFPETFQFTYMHKDLATNGPVSFNQSSVLAGHESPSSTNQVNVFGLSGSNGQLGLKWDAGRAGNVAAVQMYLDTTGSPTDGLRVKLYDGEPDTGTLVGTSATINGTDISSPGRLRYFAFSPPVTINSGQYTVVLERTGSRDLSNYYSAGGANQSDAEHTQKIDTNGSWAGSWVSTNVHFLAMTQASLPYPYDHRSTYGFIHDGSFEQQGMFEDPDFNAFYIPTWLEDADTVTTLGSGHAHSGTYPWQKFQKIIADWRNTNENNSSIRGPLGQFTANAGNHWVQGTDTNSRWSVTSEDSYGETTETRYIGPYAAKYVFDTYPQSRWMVPISVSDFSWSSPHWWAHTDTQVTPHNWDIHEWDLTTHVLPISGASSSFPYGVWDGPVGNPGWQVIRYICRTKSDGPLQCRMQVNWMYGDVRQPDPLFPASMADRQRRIDTVLELGGEIIDTRFNIARMSTTDALFDMVPGEWNTHTMDWAFPQYLLNPVVPWSGDVEPNFLAGDDDHYVLFRIRFEGGTPGQVVYLDEVEAGPVLQTFPALPLLTIGVQEWIQDDNGFYVGANLWFKTKSATAGIIS
jgi:hypothetical protein